MQSAGTGVTSRRARMEPQIRFCTTTDGVRIAFGATGDGSAPGILVPSLLSPTRLLAHDPAYRELAARESAALRRRMIFFDRRGTGLSERDVDDFRPEVLVRDVEAVVDHLDLQPALVMGIDTACAVAVEFAVRHPERVSHLVLFAPFRRGATSHRGGPRPRHELARSGETSPRASPRHPRRARCWSRTRCAASRGRRRACRSPTAASTGYAASPSPYACGQCPTRRTSSRRSDARSCGRGGGR